MKKRNDPFSFLDTLLKSSAWIGFSLAMGWASLFKLCGVGTFWFILTGLAGVAGVFYYRNKLKNLGK